MNIKRTQTCLILAILLTANCVSAQQQRGSRDHADREVLVWSRNANEPLFVTTRLQTQLDPGFGIVYQDRGFSVSLFQPLTFSPRGGYFIWWVTLENQMGERMICFKRESDKQFRASGIDADLKDLGELKQITTGGGSRFVFAVAGDGQLRLVSATTAAAEHMFVDYTTAGRVERIHDDLAREATPQYDNGLVQQLIQTWFEHGHKNLTVAVLK